MKASNTTESVSMSVDSGSMVFDSAAYPNKEILVDNFRFTKTEDIIFALEVDGEFVYNLLRRKIYEKPNAKANENTALEVFCHSNSQMLRKRCDRTTLSCCILMMQMLDCGKE